MATSREETRAITIVKIAPLNIWPIKPKSFIKKTKGINTQIVVRLPEITDMSISWLPKIAEIFGLAPRCRYAKILSIITMEASTIIPTPRIRPVKVIMFKVIPNMLIVNRVIIIESGIEIAMMIVDLKL